MKNRLRALRARQGWSQADLARRLGVSRQTVNAVETERYEPSLGLAFKVANLFDLRIEDVFHPDHVPAPTAAQVPDAQRRATSLSEPGPPEHRAPVAEMDLTML